MSEQDQTLIDPALHAEDEAYRSSLGGIYPSQGQGRAGNNNNNSSGGLEDEGYGPRSHPHPGRAGDGPAVKKKRTSSAAAAAGDEEGRKKSRQSRESILTHV